MYWKTDLFNLFKNYDTKLRPLRTNG
uniref:Biopterin-dependent aromatic amino acid hydroxylase family profile domain-containing protein n=1 Tax=mine drainage metagenome TaxID=410659 RepID=E6QR24_9ZZZZ